MECVTIRSALKAKLKVVPLGRRKMIQIEIWTCRRERRTPEKLNMWI